MGATRRGVYYDLNESIYSYTAYGLVFYFSSNLHKEKFKKEVQNYVMKESKKLKYYYSINIEFDSFFALSFYKKIENRRIQGAFFRKEQFNL